jgi:hypothetical protein
MTGGINIKGGPFARDLVVTNSETGEEIVGIQKLSLSVEPGEIIKATIEVVVNDIDVSVFPNDTKQECTVFDIDITSLKDSSKQSRRIY